MERWLRGQYSCYLAIISDAAVGYALYRDDGDYYYLRRLYVAREYRRQGIASTLLDWLYASRWTDKKVKLEVLPHNDRALAFYTAYGFQIECISMVKSQLLQP